MIPLYPSVPTMIICTEWMPQALLYLAFRSRPGGDVFTTPLPADLDRSGLPTLVFGSDDGCLYGVSLEPSAACGCRLKESARFALGEALP